MTRIVAVPTGGPEASKSNGLRKSGKSKRPRAFRGVPQANFPPWRRDADWGHNLVCQAPAPPLLRGQRLLDRRHCASCARSSCVSWPRYGDGGHHPTEAAVLQAPGAKAPHHHRPAHRHKGLHPVEAVLHCYRAAVSRYRRGALVQHRHQGLLPLAGAPRYEALR